jgi:hypothetical protein
LPLSPSVPLKNEAPVLGCKRQRLRVEKVGLAVGVVELRSDQRARLCQVVTEEREVAWAPPPRSSVGVGS